MAWDTVMHTLTGYDLREKLHDSTRSSVYRGHRERDGLPVVVKIPKNEHPTPDEITRFRREHEILRGIEHTHVIGTHGLDRYENRFALIMEDFGGRSLRAYFTGRRLPVGEVLGIAIQIADALGEIHRRGIIHKDVNPNNVVIHPETGIVKVIDFGLSTILPKESPILKSPHVLEGTLAYISPEQTGRMNRVVDYRTDFYSLGVTLYEVLTGVVPFETTDPMELVHLHIAKDPAPPHALRPEIPEPVSALVRKLLSKTAEHRYQSARGLRADLAECLAQWTERGTVGPLALGQRDVSDKLHIPQKLYGREAEIDVLLTTFDRVGSGRAELLLVAGYSGVGKSALVSETHKPITQRRGYFFSGKFDQLQRDIPYASLLQAFTDLIRQILTESDDRLALWRSAILRAVGPNGRVITDVIPEVELCIGAQPPVEALPPAETQNRFNFVFQRFVRAFSAPAHPLVVFLDDLQWADAPSLKLIQVLVSDPEARHLLIIGAYRDNEVSGAHPLLLMLDALRKAEAPVTMVLLQPLDLDNVGRLVEDSLCASPALCRPLAGLALAKTQGNPFFLGQFLRSLHDDRLLRFDADAAAWRWDLEEIRRHGITDNVVELMAGKIQRLSAAARHVLPLAASVGNTFDLRTIAIVADRPRAETTAGLWDALKEGLILPTDSDYELAQPSLVLFDGGDDRELPDVAYRFLHDRVQQAAYSLIPEGSRRALHLQVGRLMLASTPPDKLEERLFDIVNQLDRGLDLITAAETRCEVARLNLAAGRKAKASGAYEPALRYLTAGLGLLPEGAWTEQHDLAFALHVEAMEAEYLNSRFDRSREISEVALARADTVLERAKVYQTRMRSHTARNENEESIRTAVSALALLGVSLPPPEASTDQRVRDALGEAAAAVAGRSPQALAELPEMTDPARLAALELLSLACAPAYIAGSKAFPIIVCEMIKLCVRHGNSALSAHAWVFYGQLHAAVIGDVAAAHGYGELSLELLRRFDARALRAKVYALFAIFIKHWKVHARESCDLLLEALQHGLDTGDMEYTGYAANHRSAAILFAGEPLDGVDREMASYVDLLAGFKHTFAHQYQRVLRQVVLNLRGRAADPLRLVGESFDEDRSLPELVALKNTTMVGRFYACRAMLGYLLGDPERAAADAAAAAPLLGGSAGMSVVPLHNFYQSLALLSLARRAAPAERAAHLEKVEQNQARMRKWAEDGPANYLHKHLLVEAERAGIQGRTGEALDAYEQAIRAAAEQRYVHEEALAQELCGDFCLSLGRKSLAEDYLRRARNGYLRWGAAAKIAQIERRHPSLVTPQKQAYDGTRSVMLSSSGNSAVLDLETVMKAARAISAEIELPRLIDMLLRILIENAGAQRGFLLLEKDGKLAVEAEYTVGKADVIAHGGAPLEGGAHLSTAIVAYVARTAESVLLNDATAEGLFTQDPYVLARAPRSVLCTALVNQGKLVAMTYLENNLVVGAFTADRLEIVKMLLSQAALSIHNARLYARLKASNEQLEDYSHTLEQKVTERTRELRANNDELSAALAQLRATQRSLVMQEKLASLGALTSGVAHEIKNPLNFVNNFADLSLDIVDEIAATLGAEGGPPAPATLAGLQEALADLRANVEKIGGYGRRATDIINGMLLHTRDTPVAREATDLNAIVARSVDLVRHGVRARTPAFDIAIHAEYDAAVGQLELAASDISRVLVNMANNACYAVREKARRAAAGFAGEIRLQTRAMGDKAEVRIRDNGTGIPPDVAARIFNPFFTTKPPGEGTGLGLSISFDIVQGHGGEIRMETVPGEYTEFIISLPRRPTPRSAASG